MRAILIAVAVTLAIAFILSYLFDVALKHSRVRVREDETKW